MLIAFAMKCSSSPKQVCGLDPSVHQQHMMISAPLFDSLPDAILIIYVYIPPTSKVVVLVAGSITDTYCLLHGMDTTSCPSQLPLLHI